jgi:hypothetical protein
VNAADAQTSIDGALGPEARAVCTAALQCRKPRGRFLTANAQGSSGFTIGMAVIASGASARRS